MILRLCLDLNIWCAALLAERKRRQDTACQTLVKIVKDRECNWGRVELVISWGMLNRLEKVLVKDLQVSSLSAQMYLRSIESYTLQSPQLTLGGTGVVPLHDTEDAHVLETAVAGKAQVLVTANFRDFVDKNVEIVLENRHGVYRSADFRCHIVHPYLMVHWLDNLAFYPDF
ncbi:PIN domain-containing protein [Pleurocapsales cyanobacterium LEGE 10410]|nr:PIN domain-containing protein [Pleurocapsales cyanobacterium LEGE 10410]